MVKKFRSLALLFAVSLFASALLLFWVQPLVAKMLLPYLGGSPAVWNTCMLFFQAVLLLGYAYSHVLPRVMGTRRHAFLHIGLLVLAVVFLPFAVSERALAQLSNGANPSLWLLGTLAVMVGLPFFILSTNAPLLQRWFAATSHPDAKDPYFLYGASNMGSLLALLSYPVLVEPTLRLGEQSRWWTIAYILMVVLIALCAFAPSLLGALKSDSEKDEASDTESATVDEPEKERVADVEQAAGDRQEQEEPEAATLQAAEAEDRTPLAAREEPLASELSWRRRLGWVVLAFAPSSLMLGVTTFLSTDLAPIPLLWVVPLALYLLTFVLVFTKRRIVPQRFVARYVMPLSALAVVYTLATEMNRPLWLLILLHLVFFFFATLVCHGRLAATRPAATHLTEFYLWIAVGGVLGGIFNALLAPVLFNRVIEYPLVVVLACMLRPPTGKKQGGRWARLLDILIPLVFAALLVALALYFSKWNGALNWNTYVLPVAMCLAILFVDRPVRFGLCVGAILLGSALYPHGDRQLHVERNFFGVLTVLSDADGGRHHLHHGTTRHGTQETDPETRCEPISYYFRTGPFGLVYEAYAARKTSPHVAAVGLGAGTMVSYGAPGEDWTFYEIDPAVLRIAQNPNYFTYLSACAKVPVRFELGDARLRLREAPEGHYGLIVLDAFSSDAIPVHLMTREAVALYLSKLAPGGILAFHISNRHLDLGPILGGIAATNNLACLINSDSNDDERDRIMGKDASTWVAIARNPEDLQKLSSDSRWQPVEVGAKPLVWTDDFSNIFSVLK